MNAITKVAYLSLITFSIGLAQDDFFEPITTIGGYGELHYNYKKVGDEDPSRVTDFHRFILFISHSWTEKWSFKSELELEHNFVKEGHGELELEQAYINYNADNFGFQAGVILPSVGLRNEYHEPPLFLSVERPEYAKYIVPTTWFGNGAAIYGNFSDFYWRTVVMEGLNGDNISSKWDQGIRAGRQKGYKSNAETLLYNLRADYVGLPGLRIGGSFSSNDAVVTKEGQENIGVQLFEVHAELEKWNLIGIFEWGNINYTNHIINSSTGYYLDLGYNIGYIINIEGQIIPWIRFTDINISVGHEMESANHYTKLMAGLTFKPIGQISFKIDYGVKKPKDSNIDETTLFNLGVGYNF